MPWKERTEKKEQMAADEENKAHSSHVRWQLQVRKRAASTKRARREVVVGDAALRLKEQADRGALTALKSKAAT